MFEGNPLKYHSFIMSFQSMVANIPNDSIKLNNLISSCKGNARDAIEFCVMKPPEEGYAAALGALRSRFGSNVVVSQAWISKVIDRESVSVTNLSGYAADLENCLQSLEALGYLNELDNQASLRQIVSKLPKFLQNRWRTENQRIKERGRESSANLAAAASVHVAREDSGRVARLADLVRFIKRAADEVEDPVFGDVGVSKASERARLSKPSERMRPSRQYDKMLVNQAAFTQGVSKPPRCWVCKNNQHWTDQCTLFENASPPERRKMCYDNYACYSCLKVAGRGHRESTCSKRKACGETTANGACKEFHHKLLHVRKEVGQIGNLNMSKNKDPMLSILDVEVLTKGRKEVSSVLLDKGSQGTLISKDFARKLNLKGKAVAAIITKVGGIEEEFQSTLYELTLRGEDSMTHRISALEIGHINDVREVDVKQMERLFKMKPGTLKRRGGPIDILIGVNYAHLLAGEESELNGIVAQRTPLGWTVYGGEETTTANQVMHMQIKKPVDLDDFWNTEALGVDIGPCDCKSLERATEKLEGKIIRESCTKVGNQWMVPYPWAKDPCDLEDNRYQAKKILVGLEKRLLRNKGQAEAYDKQMQEMVEMGFSRKLTPEEVDSYQGPVHYIPHHSVAKRDSSSTPLRIVFNASNRYNGKCINDCWMKGPDLLCSLFGVILRFRENQVALVGDISKMYHRILIPTIDQHVHGYLWRDLDVDREPDVYVKHVLSFWDKHAGTMAITALRLTADEGREEYPRAAEVIEANTYMDDMCPSVKSEAEATLVQEVDRLLALGGFEVKAWSSNIDLEGTKCEVVDKLEVARPELFGKQMVEVGHRSEQKVLGVRWNPSDDTFVFNVEIDIEKFTKRRVLGVMAKVFDPVGLVGQVIINGKIKMQ
ncbi:PREDICTED: uncharacterized protein LOC106814832 [Priapulus caudatus]|uniref:Uncharacterized protein LOC106814832 n=1 Tax=Priapulus caudatus TaxID=37621 RepID=A0ABM1ER55_PRICU|nr:PREDICTED: uncharacterized protein LOC106814832 [Priapulus caudatus]